MYKMVKHDSGMQFFFFFLMDRIMQVFFLIHGQNSVFRKKKNVPL